MNSQSVVSESLNINSRDEIFCSFHLDNLEVALNVKSIQEVVNLPEKIIKMPLAPEYLEGVFNLRGLIIPIINLKALLKFEKHEVLSTQKVGIVDYEGVKVGLLFDSTSEIVRVNHQVLTEFKYSGEKSTKVISGAIKLNSGQRILQIIDPFKIINIENIPQILEHQKKNNQQFIQNNYDHENRKKCITFVAENIKMAFEITAIYEIIKITEIQKSSIENEFCVGVVNLRGHTVPIIDLAILLKSQNHRTTDRNNEFQNNISEKRIIVLKIENTLFGLLVDSVESINTYLKSDVMPIPLLNQTRSKMFQGCITMNELGEVILLNDHEILSSKEVFDITQGHSKIYNSEVEKDKISTKTSSRQSYISFKLGHHFGVSIKDIREIINYSEEIVAAPGIPSFVKGVLNLRGKLITIISTRSLYSMSEQLKNDTESSKILIFEIGDERFGLVVDSVESIISVDENNKQKVPTIMVKNIQDQFENDIKEIITYHHMNEEKEGILIILNIESVVSRIKKTIAA